MSFGCGNQSVINQKTEHLHEDPVLVPEDEGSWVVGGDRERETIEIKTTEPKEKKSRNIIHRPNASSLPVVGVNIGPGHFQRLIRLLST